MQKSNNRGIDYPKVSQYIRIIRDENKENTINDYSKKIDILIDEEKQTYEELENNKIDINLVKEKLKKYIDTIGAYEETLASIDNSTIKAKLLKANKLFRDIQLSYMDKQFREYNGILDKNFNEYNKKMDETAKETQEHTSSLLFNVISIFLGISITSAMITGFRNVEAEFTIFYFMSCAWMALTIITVAALYLKTNNNNKPIVVIYIIFSILWILIGIVSYDIYKENNPKENICEETVVKENIEEKENTNNN